MEYIAFFDMLGTRLSASMGNDAYSKKLKAFRRSIEQASKQSKSCEIYAYSDNAYIQFEDSESMLNFFRALRDMMMTMGHYFSAAVGIGTLNSHSNDTKDSIEYHLGSCKGNSMMFVSPDAVNVYALQSQFCGIGICLSHDAVDQLRLEGKENAFCETIYKTEDRDDSSKSTIVKAYDITYSNVPVSLIRAIISDYLIASMTSERSGRYYITAIISMIRSMKQTTLLRNLKEISAQLSLKPYQNLFKLKRISSDRVLYLFSLLDRILQLCEINPEMNKYELCNTIIISSNLSIQDYMDNIPKISDEIMSLKRKRELISILFELNNAPTLSKNSSQI